MKKVFLKSVADLRFAITILLIIASVSIIGTIIEQDQTIEIYKLNYPLTNKLFGILSWDIIIKFGFDHIYKTLWFIFLVFIFGLSLLTCTFLQQFPLLRISRRCQFFRTIQQFSNLKQFKQVSSRSFNQILFQLKKNQYIIFQQKDIVYCYKGVIGRVAPLIVHFSMIFILLGSIMGSISGFKTQEVVPKTEVFYPQNLINIGEISVIPKVPIRINDFWILYNKKNTISQFYSDLSFLRNNGQEIKRETIFVNSPAIFNSIYCYQLDWDLIAVRIKTSNNYINQYPLIHNLSQQSKISFSWIPINSTLTEGLILVVNSLQGFCSAYSQNGQFLGNLELNEVYSLDSKLSLVDIISSTGLQIKKDPSIPVIYTGFFFLMVSTLISYITYSQIWILNDSNDNKLIIGGNSTRAQFEFEQEYYNITLL